MNRDTPNACKPTTAPIAHQVNSLKNVLHAFVTIAVQRYAKVRLFPVCNTWSPWRRCARCSTFDMFGQICDHFPAASSSMIIVVFEVDCNSYFKIDAAPESSVQRGLESLHLLSQTLEPFLHRCDLIVDLLD